MCWSTKSEIGYLNGLPTGAWLDKRKPAIPPKQLLENYIKSAKIRQKNGLTPNIDWNKCIEHAESLMESY